MTEQDTQVDWQKILLQPQPNWYSKDCPVVEETTLNETGEIIEKRLARVSPVRPFFNTETRPYGEVAGTQIVTLDYEMTESNGSSYTPGVEVEVLQAGGWRDEWAKQTHILEFKGLTTDKDMAGKKWSMTF